MRHKPLSNLTTIYPSDTLVMWLKKHCLIGMEETALDGAHGMLDALLEL